MAMSIKKYIKMIFFFTSLLVRTHYVANKNTFNVQLHLKDFFSAFMLQNTLYPIQNQVQH